MKAEFHMEGEPPRLVCSFTIESEADAIKAVEAIAVASEIVWPGIVFGAESEAEAKCGAAKDYTKAPKPDKLNGRVLDAARRLKTTDAVAIADALDITSGMAARMLGMLRKGGHLRGLE